VRGRRPAACASRKLRTCTAHAPAVTRRAREAAV
jgi:hypothetical protein